MPSQHQTLEFFTALRLLQTSWAGTLLLGIGLDETGRALALASLAAGAAALFLDAEPDNLRTVARDGCSTFTVTTLDEALRALKNEVRQGRAITVALSGNPDPWLRKIVERGVQPQYLAPSNLAGQASIPTLQARGARVLAGLGLHPVADAINLDQYIATAANARWSIAEDIAPTLGERRTQDASLLAELDGRDPTAMLTRQWLRVAPTLFPRALDRAVWTRSL